MKVWNLTEMAPDFNPRLPAMYFLPCAAADLQYTSLKWLAALEVSIENLRCIDLTERPFENMG